MKIVKVNGVIANGIGVFFDGCHKLYVAENYQDILAMHERGWSMSDFFPMSALEELYNNSCDLRFISNVALDKSYVGQGEDAVFEWFEVSLPNPIDVIKTFVRSNINEFVELFKNSHDFYKAEDIENSSYSYSYLDMNFNKDTDIQNLSVSNFTFKPYDERMVGFVSLLEVSFDDLPDPELSFEDAVKNEILSGLK